MGCSTPAPIMLVHSGVFTCIHARAAYNVAWIVAGAARRHSSLARWESRLTPRLPAAAVVLTHPPPPNLYCPTHPFPPHPQGYGGSISSTPTPFLQHPSSPGASPSSSLTHAGHSHGHSAVTFQSDYPPPAPLTGGMAAAARLVSSRRSSMAMSGTLGSPVLGSGYGSASWTGEGPRASNSGHVHMVQMGRDVVAELQKKASWSAGCTDGCVRERAGKGLCCNGLCERCGGFLQPTEGHFSSAGV